MPTTITAPRSAAEAAHQLAREGKHVHLVSDGHSTCLKGCCGPAPLELPAATRERAQYTRLAMVYGISRL
ncbi:hypothetical protein EDD90_7381 [Streptomyces sp. Ag109_O5-1]|uniref:hypothetical protein n=1 Tax=Streptomyces sp. Ag109_O5-1 TaxID=1938851 RepID=UPI000F4EDAEA|nr:hypothetical protein [Streptomyces sp. Ag109_O5-1]RPE44151.1 hypothetical protein EDD90_7381 [Streptomyces sp. Ag109_O5-1]